ncbi:unnamed protein product, partial [Ixodes pacificus]
MEAYAQAPPEVNYIENNAIYTVNNQTNISSMLGFSSKKFIDLLHKVRLALGAAAHPDNAHPMQRIVFGVFESCAIILFEMEIKEENDLRYLNDGRLYTAMAALEYLRSSIISLGSSSPSSMVQRCVRELKTYVHAFATAMLRAVLVRIHYIVDTIRVLYTINENTTNNKIYKASLVGIANYAAKRAKCNPLIYYTSTASYNWFNICNVLSLYPHMQGNVAPINDPVLTDMKLKFANNNTIHDVITMLVDDCNRIDAMENGIGRCDTDFMTLRTVMPMNVHGDDDNAIIDPARSTTLKDHNDLILKTFDTVPVPSTSRYYLQIQNSSPETTHVGVMNIARVVQQCMSNSRADKRFMEIHRSTPAGVAELERFYSQACTISPRNIGLFLQCLNFEMMDPELFSAILSCLDATSGMPIPDEKEISKYANDAMFRMAVNLFYHSRIVRSFKGDDIYVHDSMFFNNFLEWIQEEYHMEHHIPSSVASSIMSWCTSMSTAMHTTRDQNGGTKYAMAALTTCEVDNRVLADFLNMFIKMYIEDETEVTIINKKFLENALLKVFESKKNTYHLAKGQFISPTALRLFLARCRWSIADDIRLIFPVCVKFFDSIITDNTDSTTESARENAKRNMEHVATMVAPLLVNPN